MVSVSSIGNSCVQTSVSQKIGTLGRRVYNSIPNTVFKKDYWVDKIAVMGKKCSSAEQRLILGVTALATQPLLVLLLKSLPEHLQVLLSVKAVLKQLAPGLKKPVMLIKLEILLNLQN